MVFIAFQVYNHASFLWGDAFFFGNSSHFMGIGVSVRYWKQQWDYMIYQPKYTKVGLTTDRIMTGLNCQEKVGSSPRPSRAH